MPNVFISYCRESQEFVGGLAEDFETLGHEVWFDHGLSGGQAWWDQILKSIRECDVFVFVLAPQALTSTACKREYRYAADIGKPVLPILAADEVSVNLLDPTLSKIQYVDYRKRGAESALSLAKALGTIPPPGPLPDPLPDPPEAPISYLGNLTELVETDATLTREQQSEILVDLRSALRDPESAADARKLLRRLKERRDLLAYIGTEIDDALSTWPTRPPISKEPPRKPDAEPTHHKTTPGNRLKATAYGAIVGGLVGVIVSTTAPPGAVIWIVELIFILSGAAAGAIAGTHRRVLRISLGLAAIAWLFAAVSLGISEDFRVGFAAGAVVGACPGAIVGAIVGIILRKWKKWP